MATKHNFSKYQIHDRSVRAGIHSPRHRMPLLRILGAPYGWEIDEGQPITVLDSVVVSDGGHLRVLDAGVVATVQRGVILLHAIEHISGRRRKAISDLVSGTIHLARNLTKKHGLLFGKRVVVQANLIVHGVSEFWQPPSFAEALGAPKDWLDVCFSPEPSNVLNLRRLLYSRLETEYSEEEFIEEAYWTSLALLRTKRVSEELALRFLRAVQYYLEEGDLLAYPTILYYLSGNIDELERLEDLKAKVLTPRQLKEIDMNAGTKMILDAETRILDKGRAEGEANAILKFIRERFGSVPEQLEAKLSASPAEELDSWLGRVAHATSLDELLGSGRGRKRGAPA